MAKQFQFSAGKQAEPQTKAGLLNQITNAHPIQAAQAAPMAEPETEQQPEPAQASKRKAGKPKTRGEVYRINLGLDADLYSFLSAQAQETKIETVARGVSKIRSQTVTELINEIIRDYKTRQEN